MTTTGPARADTATAGRAGRPVRRFLLVVVGLALVAVALWWAALVNPRLDLTASGGSFDVSAFTGHVEADLTNRAPTDVTIVDVVLQVAGATPTQVSTREGSPVAGRHLSAGEQVDLVLGFTTDGCLPVALLPTALVIVTTRTPLGIERTHRFPAANAMTVATCGLR